MTNCEHYIGVALEGVSYVGKTTTLQKLAEIGVLVEKDVVIVPEYSQIGRLPNMARQSLEDARAAAEVIITLEKMRTEYLSNQMARTNGAVVYWDRGPFSCLAFEFAMGQTGAHATGQYLAERYQQEIEQNNLLLPNNFAYLYLSLEGIKAREKRMLVEGHRGVPEFFRQPEVINNINHFFNFCWRKDGGILKVNTACFSPEQVAQMVWQLTLGQSDFNRYNLADLYKEFQQPCTA